MVMMSSALVDVGTQPRLLPVVVGRHCHPPWPSILLIASPPFQNFVVGNGPLVRLNLLCGLPEHYMGSQN